MFQKVQNFTEDFSGHVERDLTNLPSNVRQNPKLFAQNPENAYEIISVSKKTCFLQTFALVTWNSFFKTQSKSFSRKVQKVLLRALKKVKTKNVSKSSFFRKKIPWTRWMQFS